MTVSALKMIHCYILNVVVVTISEIIKYCTLKKRAQTRALLLFTMFSIVSIHNGNDSFTINNTSIKDCFVGFINWHLNDI